MLTNQSPFANPDHLTLPVVTSMVIPCMYVSIFIIDTNPYTYIHKYIHTYIQSLVSKNKVMFSNFIKNEICFFFYSKALFLNAFEIYLC